ncbi:MAG: hypothetical protein RR324_04645 [Cellulosilyticaceae bacterium]
MNKEAFKSILSIICVLCGALMSCLALISFDSSAPAFIACILLGISLVVIGVVSFFIHYQAHIIIKQLQNKDMTILAHWSYAPLQYDGVKESITQSRHNSLSILILLGILSSLIALGILFSNSPFALIICSSIILITFVVCICTSILIYVHYGNRLISPVEAIIGEDYIYFNEELYSLHRSIYLLTDVRLVQGDQSYLQFLYGSPCTSCEPIYILTLPIPSDQIEVAKYIRKHYLSITP